MRETAIKIENLKKQYRLGVIGGTTLSAELQSWWARKRGKEDPNLKLGEEYKGKNEAFWALNGINLEVHKGEALGIIGTNGAGKSTLLKILSRVTAPTEGDIWINGRISSMLEVGTGFHGELTGRENIYMNGAILGMSKKEVDAKMESIIDFSECRQFIDTPVKRYSSGMYVKLAFAVAAHLDSEILVMDEVLAVGDMKFQKKCLGKMGDVADNEGRTVLYVSHNMSTIRKLCARCVVLSRGKVIFNGNVDEAIDVYSGMLMEQHFANKYELEGMKRREDLGKKAHITSFEFIERDVPSYCVKEQMEFCVRWKNISSKNGIIGRIVIKTADSTIIGMAESNAMSECKSENISNFKFSLKNLTEGVYSITFSLNIRNEFGEYEMLDEEPVPIYFKIEALEELDSNTTRWIRQYWGNVHFDLMEVDNM